MFGLKRVKKKLVNWTVDQRTHQVNGKPRASSAMSNLGKCSTGISEEICYPFRRTAL
jgi:hypothetical protein